MQQIKRFLFGLFLCMVFLPCVKAACSYEERAELNTLASNVKATYEETLQERDRSEYFLPDAVLGTEEEETYKSYEEFFTINLSNINENIYAEVKNSLNGETVVLNAEDAKDGIASFPWKDRTHVTTFTIKIYAAGDACTKDVLKTIRLTVPRLNGYYYDNMCIENPEFDLCEKYVTYKEVTYEYFVRQLDQYLSNKESDKPNIPIIKQKRTRIIIGISAVVIIAVGVTAAVIIKKNRSNDI